jgi:acyl dehydratase
MSDDRRMVHGAFMEDAPVGTELPPLVRAPSYLSLLIYAGQARDYFEIHHDRDAARAAGHPDVVIQGPLKSAFLGQLITDWLGTRGTLRRLEVAYRGIDTPGSRLSARGIVRRTWSEDGCHLVECELWIENEAGAVTTRGSAVAALPSRSSPA